MMPALFLAHAAPSFALEDNATTRFWAGLPELLPEQPRAILCLSGHWEASALMLSSSTSIQYDFHGFPEPLYQLDWPLPVDPETTAWLQDALADIGVDITHKERPLDHGVWVPLRHAWPKPSFPVFQLSISTPQGPRWHVELGRKLAPLKASGILVIATGGIVHNLGRIDWHAHENEAADWAAAFMRNADEAIRDSDIDALCDPWGLPHGPEAVPTLDHYLPLLVTLGMASGDPLRQLHAGWSFGTLAMHSYGVGLEARP
ncbi:MAG TPA: class III extradiol ring-cleavage dioxygenase [Mariprofundaceae bacterium]|nr:class III extradiol ring-cleavage dioxygenase [Mariprofundaceae bacterium]